jgi:NitT/TauT family transport system substrate-binding protein
MRGRLTVNQVRRTARVLVATFAILFLFATTACARIDRNPAAQPTDLGPAAELRLGYFPNVTHAGALIGLDQGLFSKQLGTTKLVPTQFNAGPDEVNALLGGSLDIGFIGSGPTINVFSKSGGEAVRLISGATSGGAQLVVQPQINTQQDLRGKTVATPELGNTQDVSLKKWLAEQKLADVNVQNSDNATTLTQLKQGRLAGAWLPEPWSSRAVQESGARVLLDEKTLWPNGQFPTTVVVVRTQFLSQHPETVRAFLRGLLDANNVAATNPAAAKEAANRQLAQLTGKPLAPQVLDSAFSDIQLTVDPLAARFPQLAQDQVTAGIVKQAPKLNGLVDLGLLNAELQQAGKPPIDAAGLDKR